MTGGQGGTHPPGPESWDAETAYEIVETRVHAAVRRLGHHRLADAELACAAERLVAGVAPHPRHVVEAVVGDLLVRAVRAVADGGWSPTDLAELVRRNLGPAYVPALAAALHEDCRHRRRGHAWQSAVDRVESQPALLLGASEALPSALGLAALLIHTPLLSDAVATRPEDGPEHPKLARVRALLAKASLVSAVASANRCRAASAERWGFCVVVGAAHDLGAVELLVTSLLVQADAAMLRHGRRSDRAGTTRTRSFRQSFLTAYATRIGQRLAAADVAAARAGEVDLLPVLRSQEAKVAEEFDQLVPHTLGRASSVSDGEGWAAGLAAADLAVLDVNGRLEAG